MKGTEHTHGGGYEQRDVKVSFLAYVVVGLFLLCWRGWGGGGGDGRGLVVPERAGGRASPPSRAAAAGGREPPGRAARAAAASGPGDRPGSYPGRGRGVARPLRMD